MNLETLPITPERPPRPTAEEIADRAAQHLEKAESLRNMDGDLADRYLENIRDDLRRLVVLLETGHPDDEPDAERLLEMADGYPGFKIDDFEKVLALLPDPKKPRELN